MEQHPDARERQLNERLIAFAESILENDLMATAIVQTNLQFAPTDNTRDSWTYLGGEPSLFQNKDDMLVAGVQLSYRKPRGEFTASRVQYVYTNFFTLDPTTGEHGLSEQMQEILHAIDPSEADRLVEEAWELWLNEMHILQETAEAIFSKSVVVADNPDDFTKLGVDKQTGEIGFRYNIRPENVLDFTIPPLGQPFKVS